MLELDGMDNRMHQWVSLTNEGLTNGERRGRP